MNLLFNTYTIMYYVLMTLSLLSGVYVVTLGVAALLGLTF
jgi:hypothetical protein